MNAFLPTRLEPQAEDILAELINLMRTGNVVPGNPKTYARYGQIHTALNLEMAGNTIGVSLTNQGLRSLAEWTIRNQLPAITTLVVDDKSLVPGNEFFQLFGIDPSDFDWTATQVDDSLRLDWIQFLTARTVTQFVPVPPQASDITPPERETFQVCRIIRDTAIARKVKHLHAYKCQICGTRLTLPSGEFYAEAHHIKPLGGGHNGRDIESNILCLCPNHHVELDYGISEISADKLTKVSGHSMGEEFIAYHNEAIFGVRSQKSAPI